MATSQSRPDDDGGSARLVVELDVLQPKFSRDVAGTPLWTGMTFAINSTFRIASGLIAGLTIVAGGFVNGTDSTESAADYQVWRTNFGVTAPTAGSSVESLDGYGTWHINLA